MAIREDLVASAVTFLQDPSVSASPLENRIAFLQSKNLTQEEVDVALARASGESAPPSNYSNYAPQQQVLRQPQGGYGGYQQYPGAWQPPPPEVPKRDWRDWFIMATMMGGVGYGLYFVAKRYVVPLIAPPTPEQIEQDKASIDASFEKAFSLLDQLSTDTASLKASEAARTDRLDVALTEVETVISELKSASRRREEESHRINAEVRGLKDLIPKAMEGQKESMDMRLTELNNELKSLKKLMGQRMNSPAVPNSPIPSQTPAPYNQFSAPVKSTTPQAVPSTADNFTTTSSPSSSAAIPTTTPRPAAVTSASGTTETTASLSNSSRPGSTIPFGSSGMPARTAAIPAWQRAAADKAAAAPAAPAPGVDSDGGLKEAGSVA